MAIQTHTSSLSFNDLMAKFEGNISVPYDDGKKIATIGIGVNIEREEREPGFGISVN